MAALDHPQHHGFGSHGFGETGQEANQLDVLVWWKSGPDALPDSLDERCQIRLLLDARGSEPQEPIHFLCPTAPFELNDDAVDDVRCVERRNRGGEVHAITAAKRAS
jgi:hypothetical protein